MENQNQTVTIVDDIIAISHSDHKKFGCINCGCKNGSVSFSTPGERAWNCAQCGRGFVIRASGVEKPLISVVLDGQEIYPELKPHPRQGTPAHALEKGPDGDKVLTVQGIGLYMVPGCFVCGGGMALLPGIAITVHLKPTIETVIRLFEDKGVRTYPGDASKLKDMKGRVTVGACFKHMTNLKCLMESIKAANTIRKGMIEEARK